MIPTITAFENSPDKGEGQARDMRVRWALEEVGQPYDVRLVSMKALKQPAHRAIHPFGKIPTYQEGDLALFESGAIVLHLAERHRGLLSEQADARSRAIVWLFAALNTVEPVRRATRSVRAFARRTASRRRAGMSDVSFVAAPLDPVRRAMRKP